MCFLLRPELSALLRSCYLVFAPALELLLHFLLILCYGTRNCRLYMLDFSYAVINSSYTVRYVVTVRVCCVLHYV
jgi:hypothetical protein